MSDMLGFLLRNPFVTGGRRSAGTFLRLLHHEPISKPYPKTSPSSPVSDLAVSFFKTSCALSPSAALASAAKINMKTTEKAESVLRLLQTYGFTKSTIAIISAKQPALFTYHPEKYTKPKLDLFLAAGFTGNIIQNIISKAPGILNSSLEKKLSPNLHLLMTILGGDKKAVAASIARDPRILSSNATKKMLPNIETLRLHGAGASISKLVTWCPRVINQEAVRFSKIVALIENMGFNSSDTLFINGIRVISGVNPPAWERKMQLYRSLGWSQEQTLSAFKKFPMFMLVSEEKVRKITAFFVENLKWEPFCLASVPQLFVYSFEKRIVPRYVVFNILSTSGLSHMNISFPSLIRMSESDFLKYLCKYSEKVPKLLEAYKVKLDMGVTIPSKCVI